MIAIGAQGRWSRDASNIILAPALESISPTREMPEIADVQTLLVGVYTVD